jgi:4-amino-4-deoxy-L-arabinose transferase and related glycosyltransferases of PMT family
MSKSLIYRWRYQIGYSCLVLIFAFTLLFLSNTSPGGVTEAEMSSAVGSYELGTGNIFSTGILDAPYKFLQKASIGVFGLSVFSIKLPSIILAFFTGLGLIVLLNRWYKSNVAVLASSVVITSCLFLFSSQNGTPSIMYIFWPVILLILGSLIINEEKINPLCPALLSITLGLSLYSPFMIYVVAAIAVSAIIHPHLRFTIKSIPMVYTATSLTIFALVIAPLIISTIADINVLSILLADNNLMNFSVFESIKTAIMPFVSFNSNLDGAILTPVFGLTSITLAVLGLTSSIRERYTAKNYILAIWMIFSILAIALAPDRIAIIFVPITILIASGIEFVIEKWYSLFPENPYARVGGLVPIALFIAISIFTSVEHYAFGYYYTPQVTKHFNDDISLIRSNLQDSTVILAPKDSVEYDFYSILGRQKDIAVVDETPETINSNLIVLRNAKAEGAGYQLVNIVTSAKTSNSDRLYIYQSK